MYEEGRAIFEFPWEWCQGFPENSKDVANWFCSNVLFKKLPCKCSQPWRVSGTLRLARTSPQRAGSDPVEASLHARLYTNTNNPLEDRSLKRFC